MTAKKHYDIRFPTYQEFESYLKNKAADDPAAPFCQSGRCPIAQWAADTLLFPAKATILVDGCGIKALTSSKTFVAESDAAPDWVNPFIDLVDAVATPWDETPVSTTLRCLRKAVRSVGDGE